MSYSSEPAHTREDLQESNYVISNADLALRNASGLNNPAKRSSTPPTTRRSEVLRHVFPRPSRGGVVPNRRDSSPLTGNEILRSTSSSPRHSRPRVTFRKVITSIFNSSATREVPQVERTRANSKNPSIRSRSGSVHGSLPSLEVVSPGAFLFSGPSLKSTHSGSRSTSRLPSLTEAGSDLHSLRRAHSEAFSIESVALCKESILEPFDDVVITRSISDILLGTNTSFDELEGPILEDLNEDAQSLAEMSSSTESKAPCLTPVIVELLLPYLNKQSWKALRLTCRSWHAAVRIKAPLRLPNSFSIPVEVLQHIYTLLAPRDFNAARHTCCSWMRSSLDKNLLTTMLKRGGWWTSAEIDFHKRTLLMGHTRPSTRTSDEWFLSRRLSRECSLSGTWTGNGLQTPRDQRNIIEVSRTDFSDLANGYPGPDGRRSTGLVFTASICSQLLLVARDNLIFVYSLRSSDLRPITSVACPRRVLAMSLDSSSGRNAVAALLEGRMGMVCELRFGRDKGDTSPMEVHVESHGHPYRSTAKTSILTSRASEFEAGVDAVEPICAGKLSPSRRSVDAQERDLTEFDSVDVQANYDAFTLQGTNDPRTHDQNWINHTWNLNLRAVPKIADFKMSARSRSACDRVIPIETGTSTFYRHLCSEDDPPRSVSICPQRRCVAFGCSASIELHWVDALTGQSLSRWFPLTAPSDYLYFLPPRPGFESAKKLRLISSAAHPDDRPAISRRFFSSYRPTSGLFWGAFGFESRGGPAGSSGCDHYHAIPLSDGHHVLFIDPPTDRLYMGCDAPLGGPTKLLRKILFVPPDEDQVPRLYTAAADLSWGARVAVVYGDNIMLYSVPADVFALSRLEQKAESWDVYTAPPFSTEGRSEDHWLNWWNEPYVPLRSPIWPIAVRGVEVGNVRGVCDLAVFTYPDITVWGFTLDCQARTWQVRNQAELATRSRWYICRSGLVHDSASIDELGDAIIRDVDGPADQIEFERSLDFDVHSERTLPKCLPKALHIQNDDWLHTLDVRGWEAWYDTNGDVFLGHQIVDSPKDS